MKIIAIRNTTNVIADVLGQVVNIHCYERSAEFTILNENNVQEHYTCYNAADDMMFVTLLGKGNRDDDETWTKFSNFAGWYHTIYQFKEASNPKVAAELVDCIEHCIEQIRKYEKLSGLLHDAAAAVIK